jgi:hypothetical protein
MESSPAVRGLSQQERVKWWIEIIGFWYIRFVKEMTTMYESRVF